MDTSGVTPKKSPAAENVQRRRLDIQNSDLAAYWALFNTAVAMLLYYDLCYLRVLEDLSILLIYIEWIVCSLFTASACYDYYIHFWPHTFMRPIVLSPTDKELLGIQDDEMGFKISEPQQVKQELTYDSFPPFEIHHSFEEDDKIVTPPKRVYSFLRMSQINSRNRSPN